MRAVVADIFRPNDLRAFIPVMDLSHLLAVPIAMRNSGVVKITRYIMDFEDILFYYCIP